LKRGLKSVPDSHAVALEGDLTNLGKIPDRSADVVLSTNTMYQISMPAREDAVRELCRITAPDGICIIEYTKDDDFAASLKITQGFFRDVRVVYFKNPISRWYEKMAYNSLSKERKLFASFPFRVLSWCISRLEYLTQKKASLNGHAIVIARQLFLPGTRNYVTLKDMRQIEERLYSLS
jgi:ubiquinone/menaquinone biosynthesis C-methylase UbiE